MKRNNTVKSAISLILALTMTATFAACSSQEEISPADGKDTAADDYFDFSDITVAVEITDEDGNTVTAVISGEPAEPDEDSSDTSAEAGSASTTSNGTNLPTVTSTQTTKPATTTAPGGSSPAVTTRPSTSLITTTAPVVTTAPAPAVTPAPKPSVTTYPEPVVTTTPAPVVTQPPVTTTPQPPVTTTPAPVPGHTHSYTSKVAKEPTCTATGTRTYTCSCGDKYTESIPAKGHDWHTETVHHDAVIGTRDVTETWVRCTYLVWIRLTQEGIDAGLSSPESYGYYKAIAAIGYGKLGDNGKVIQDTIIWEYLYKDTFEDSMAYCSIDYGCDLLRKGYGDGTYVDSTDIEYEEKVVGTESYVITPAYDETITTCSVCGSKK